MNKKFLREIDLRNLISLFDRNSKKELNGYYSFLVRLAPLDCLERIFFAAKFNHDAICPDMADSLLEPCVCNCEPSREEKIIFVIHEANKTPRENGLRAISRLSKYCPSSFTLQMYPLVL